MQKEGSMTVEELRMQGAIYITRIEEGLDNYPNTLLEGSKEELFQVIHKIYECSRPKSSYVDFYYGRLTPKE